MAFTGTGRLGPTHVRLGEGGAWSVLRQMMMKPKRRAAGRRRLGGLVHLMVVDDDERMNGER